MKRILAGIAIALAACVSVPQWADAQQRDGRDYQRDRGHYGDRDRGRGYGQHQKRHYYRERRPGYVYHPGYGWYDPSAVIGGAIGGWLYRQFSSPPEPVPEAAPLRDAAWCAHRYKSYDPYTRTYLGYDGLRHGCP